MPTSNWSSARYAITGFTVLIILVFITIGAHEFGFDSGKDEGERIANSDTYSRHTQQDIQKCLRGPESEVQECIEKVVEATNEHKRAEGDLKAQKTMARFTFVMGLTGVVGLFVGSFSMYLIWLTVRETRRVGRDQSRAYLHVDEVEFYWGNEELEFPKIRAYIKNSGNTPAKWYQIRVKPHVYKFEEAATAHPSKWSEIGLDEEFRGRWNGIPPSGDGRGISAAVELADERVDIHKALHGLYSAQDYGFTIFGEIQYCTFFDEVFTSQFCYGSHGLRPFKIKDTVVEEQSGISITRNLEEPIILSRWSFDLETYRRDDES